MGTHILPPASGPGVSLRGILPQPWPETGQQSHETLTSVTTQIKDTGFYSLAHLQDRSAWVRRLLLQQLRFSSVQNKAFPKCLLWLESACPLSWSFWNTGIFQRKRKHPVLTGIFHGYSLPRGDLSLQENFQHYVIFFLFCCLYLQRQADKWRDK